MSRQVQTLTRRCSRCKESKPVLAFSGGQHACRPCQNEKSKASYHKAMLDPARRKALADRKAEQRRRIAIVVPVA